LGFVKRVYEENQRKKNKKFEWHEPIAVCRFGIINEDR
jgi:hypothetical protein